MMFISDFFKNKSFLVLGYGLTGQATATALDASGARVYVYDDELSSATVQISCNVITNLKQVSWQKIDYVIASPGIDLRGHPISQYVDKNKIISDIDLLYLANPNALFIGVTGTNGKSTTVSLIHHILNKKGYKVQLGGNIGIPALKLSNSDSIYVLELSSFQIDLNKHLCLDYAILLNIAADHLDRYKDIAEYTRSKLKIFSNLKENGIGIIHKNIDFNSSCNLIRFSGEGAQMNIEAAKAVCELITKQKILAEDYQDFQALPHRMQKIHATREISFVNDSKATNTHAAAFALSSYRNIYWIAGNINKDGEVNNLSKYADNIKRAYFIGRSADEFAKIFDNKIPYVISETLENALKQIKHDIASDTKHKTILLSPAGASFDQWDNFMQRGEDFIKLVEKIFGESGE